MKKLADYQGEDAIELWADLLEPMTEILGDKDIAKILQDNKKPPLLKAKAILKKYSKEAEEILLRIDPTPINGLNLVIRLTSILVEAGQNDEIKAFFGFAGQAETESESSGSPTETTEADEK